MGAEVRQHQERAKFEDQLARKRYDDQLSQQVKYTEKHVYMYVRVCAWLHILACHATTPGFVLAKCIGQLVNI